MIIKFNKLYTHGKPRKVIGLEMNKKICYIKPVPYTRSQIRQMLNSGLFVFNIEDYQNWVYHFYTHPNTVNKIISKYQGRPDPKVNQIIHSTQCTYNNFLQAWFELLDQEKNNNIREQLQSGKNPQISKEDKQLYRDFGLQTVFDFDKITINKIKQIRQNLDKQNPNEQQKIVKQIYELLIKQTTKLTRKLKTNQTQIKKYTKLLANDLTNNIKAEYLLHGTYPNWKIHQLNIKHYPNENVYVRY